MKTVKSVIPKMLGFFLVMLVITSLIYPAVITAAARTMFPDVKTQITVKFGTSHAILILTE